MYPLWDPEWLREVFRDRPHIFVENPDGCPRQDGEALTCRGGFKVGRVVLVEILRTSDKMLNLMLGGHHDMAMDAWRREAEDRQDKEFVYFAKPGDIMFREPLTLRDKAIAGVREGRFSPIEVARCINI